MVFAVFRMGGGGFCSLSNRAGSSCYKPNFTGERGDLPLGTSKFEALKFVMLTPKAGVVLLWGFGWLGLALWLYG